MRTTSTQTDPVLPRRLPLKKGALILFSFIVVSQFVACGALKSGVSPVAAMSGEVSGEEKEGKIPPPDAYYHTIIGLQLEGEGDNSSALDAYRKALQYDPESPFLLTRAADLLNQLGEPKEALSTAERAFRLHPKDSRVLSLLGSLYVAAGQGEKALDVYQRLVEVEPKEIEAYYNLASLYAARGDLARAEEMVRKGVATDPKSGVGYFYLGKIAFENKRLDEALEYHRKALSLHPNFEQAHLEVARIHEIQGKPEEAKKVYQWVLDRINPRSREALSRLVQVWLRRQEFDEALRVLEERGEADPSNTDIPLQEAIFWVEKKDYPKAIEKVRRVIKGRPEDLRLKIYLASIHEENKEYETAISIYQELLNRDEKLYDVWIRLGSLYFYRLKDVEKALAQGDLARQVDAQRPEAYLFNGLVLQESQRYEEAISVFLDGIKKNPKLPDLHFHLGGTYDKLNRFDDLVREMEKAIALDANHANALNYLGYTYADKGIRLNEAMDLIQRALAVRPNDGYFIDSLGWAYYKKGQMPEAVEALKRAVSLVPEDPVINEHLGDAYLQQNRPDLAKEAWLRSLKLDPKNEKLIGRFKQAGFGEPMPEAEEHLQRTTDTPALQNDPPEASSQGTIPKPSVH